MINFTTINYGKYRTSLVVCVMLFRLKKCAVRPRKKKPCFSSPPALFFWCRLSFFIIFYEQCFYEQKPTDITCKAHCCCVHTKIMQIFTINLLCISKLNKLVFNGLFQKNPPPGRMGSFLNPPPSHLDFLRN